MSVREKESQKGTEKISLKVDQALSKPYCTRILDKIVPMCPSNHNHSEIV